MKSKLFFIVAIFISVFLLGACSPVNQFSSPVNQFTRFFQESTEKIVSDAGISGEITISNSRIQKYEYFSMIDYDITITSDSSELLSISELKSLLGKIDQLKIDSGNVHGYVVGPSIIINGDEYTYYESDGSETLYKNGEEYPKPEPIIDNSSSPSSGSSSGSTCDTLWNNLNLAILLSGGESTDLTETYYQALSDNGCFD